MAFYVRHGVTIPPNFPLAVIPVSAAISINSWLDADNTFLMPSAAELVEALGEQHYELADVVGTALLLSYHLALRTDVRDKGCCGKWFSLVVDRWESGTTNDHEILRHTLKEAYRCVAAHHAVPSESIFYRAAEYVLASILFVVQNEAQTSEPRSEEVTPLSNSALLLPVIDCLVNKFADGHEGNVTLGQITAGDLMDMLHPASDGDAEPFELKGCQQHLCALRARKNREEPYWIVSSTSEMFGGSELMLQQEHPPRGPVDEWSPVDRLRWRTPR